MPNLILGELELWSGIEVIILFHFILMERILEEEVLLTLPDNLYNVGVGSDLTIKELALLIQRIVGHTGEINWDSSKPDGTPRKLMDVSKMHELGWKASITLEEGIKDTYEWYLNQLK